MFKPEHRVNRLQRYRLAAGVGFFLAVLSGTAVHAGEVLPGPQPARLLEVIDGDTIRVRARIWLGTDIQTLVRIDGIDTPELRGKCAAERALAKRARERVVELATGQQLMLYNIRYGKYAGRVVARVEAQGQEIAAVLVTERLAHPYDGGARLPWCPAG